MSHVKTKCLNQSAEQTAEQREWRVVFCPYHFMREREREKERAL